MLFGWVSGVLRDKFVGGLLIFHQGKRLFSDEEYEEDFVGGIERVFFFAITV